MISSLCNCPFLGFADVTEPFDDSGVAFYNGNIPGVATGERASTTSAPKARPVTVFVVAKITSRRPERSDLLNISVLYL